MHLDAGMLLEQVRVVFPLPRQSEIDLVLAEGPPVVAPRGLDGGGERNCVQGVR